MYDELSRTIDGWLDLCGINLIENGVRWLRNELDELPYLHFQPKQTSSQCMAWQMLKDDRAAQAPNVSYCAVPPQTFCSTDQDLGESIGRGTWGRLSCRTRKELKCCFFVPRATLCTNARVIEVFEVDAV
jgi:hypothetical protein